MRICNRRLIGELIKASDEFRKVSGLDHLSFAISKNYHTVRKFDFDFFTDKTDNLGEIILQIV